MNQVLCSKGHLHPDVYSSNVQIGKLWKEPKCPSTNEWIKKMWCIYTVEYYSVNKMDEILPFAATWLELEEIMLSEMSQSEKDNYPMISVICGI